MDRYDAIIIGAGQAGDPLAKAWARAGKRTALIERLYIGGTCANTGCTPTKTMVASARVAYLARRASDFGVHGCDEITVSYSEVRERAQKIVLDFRSGGEKALRDAGVDLFFGQARFQDRQTVSIRMNDGSECQVAADQIFINVGARASVPPIEGLTEISFLDYVTVQQLETLPEHLIILGGGYIALEFGQMFRRFGSAVTIIEEAKQLLTKEDPDVAEAMAEILREDGINIYTKAKAKRVMQQGNRVTVTLETDGQCEKVLSGSHLLVATGRKPNTEDLGLETAGVAIDEHNFVKTNSRLETTAPGIIAMGDCKGGPQFTHIAYDDFRILRANLLQGKSRTTDGRSVPYTVFTDPQLGRCGMTESEARETGRPLRVAKLSMTEVARTIETDETRGFMKAVVDMETKQILGCAMLSVDGGETMAVVQMAIQSKTPYTSLRDGVFAHPTLAESLNNLFMTLDSQ